MTFFDDIFENVANDLIDLFKEEPFSFRRVEKTYDPATDTNVVSLDVTESMLATPPIGFEQKRIDNTTILSTDQRIFVARLELDRTGFDPTPGDSVQVTVTIDTKTYDVIEFREYHSGDRIASFELQLRI